MDEESKSVEIEIASECYDKIANQCTENKERVNRVAQFLFEAYLRILVQNAPKV